MKLANITIPIKSFLSCSLISTRRIQKFVNGGVVKVLKEPQKKRPLFYKKHKITIEMEDWWMSEKFGLVSTEIENLDPKKSFLTSWILLWF